MQPRSGRSRAPTSQPRRGGRHARTTRPAVEATGRTESRRPEFGRGAVAHARWSSDLRSKLPVAEEPAWLEHARDPVLQVQRIERLHLGDPPEHAAAVEPLAAHLQLERLDLPVLALALLHLPGARPG